MTIEISAGWSPGAIGDVVGAHGRYYSRNWGFGAVFEAKVAGEMAAFVHRYDPDRDRLFMASSEAGFLASLTIDGSDPDLPPRQAHLRWFIAADAARGTGVGGALMGAAMDFLSSAGYRSCYLTTFKGLDPARRLYERHGFQLVSEAKDETWGVTVNEQRFEAAL